MFYTILSSILLTFFFATGALGCWSVYKRTRLLIAPNWSDFITAYVYFAVAVFCFIAAYLVGLQIPDCYVSQF